MESNTLPQNEDIGCLTGQVNPVSNQIGNVIAKPFKIGYIVFGVLFLILGAIGTVLPLIPTTPLILLAAVCFGKSSQRLHSWFLSTRLYRKTINGYIKNHATTVKAKVILLTSVTVVMGLSLLIMTVFHPPVYLRVLLAVIWLAHVIYFGFIVKTSGKSS